MLGAPTATATVSGVFLNEVSCASPGWVELVNVSDAPVSLANWLLTDDPLDEPSVREDHRMRFGPDVVLEPGAYLVVPQGVDGYPFELTCGDDTLWLGDSGAALIDSHALLPAPANGMTDGRIPDGTGAWTPTLPTQGMANAISTSAQAGDPAWLYDPLHVTEIDLAASDAALAALNATPDEYVEARVTLRRDAATYGPYRVGLKLKGHGTFRTLAGKAAFKVKFGHAVAGQRFGGLKALTLNNMVQDPSMLAEAMSALFFAAAEVPSARVGYAYVRLNRSDYGLYANVETVDSVLARRFFTSTRHIYKAGYGHDAIPGRTHEFEIEEGSDTDRSDLEALAAANAGGVTGWYDRMQQVADLAELTRAWAAEHYAGHWDSYSVEAGSTQPNNYYLHADGDGRFTLLTSGTDQTWLERTPFGIFGKGVLFRGCVEDLSCRELYVDALRGFATDPRIADLAGAARAISAVVAPWRALDPRQEQSIAAGEAQVAQKLESMEARPRELAAWLADPVFLDAVELARTAASSTGVSPADLTVTGTVSPLSSPVGGSHVWRLQVANSTAATAHGVVLDVRLSPNVVVGFSATTRGSGCVPADVGLRCTLDWLGVAGDATATAEVVIRTDVVAAGEVRLSAEASSAQADPNPEDNTLLLVANTPVAAPVPLAAPAVRPVLGKPLALPAIPRAGKRFTFSVPVTRSDTGKPVGSAKVDCRPSVAGKALRHTESLKSGRARLSFVVPKTAAGRLLRIEMRVTLAGRTAGRTYSYRVR